MIKRVHGLYEELGREDVNEVQAWDETHNDTRKKGTKNDIKPENKTGN
jgi:hypothetical protein